MNNTLLIYLSLILFLVTAFAIGVAVFFYQRYKNPEPTEIEKRLMRVREIKEAEVVTTQGKKLNMVIQSNYENEAFGEFLDKVTLVQTLKKDIVQAGMTIAVDRFLLLFILLPLFVFLVLGIAAQMAIFVFSALLVPAGAIFILKFNRNKRLNLMLTQLPDALSMMTSSLRAGHAFQSAMTIISTEMADPIAGEFAIVVRDLNLGVPMKEALIKMQNKLDRLTDVRIFVTAVLIQREAGGNLAEVLEKLGYTIRERFKLKRQVSSLTAQSRLTGYVLGAAPIIVFGILLLIAPAYIDPLMTTELGNFSLIIAGILMCMGVFVIRRIVDIRL